MSDSSGDEDMSKFREAVNNSFAKLIDLTPGNADQKSKGQDKPKSERYLEIASHYNDVKVPDKLQRQIAAKISNIIDKNTKFVNVKMNGEPKKRKIKGGVKLFKNSNGFLTCEEQKDTYTENHNAESKKMKKKRRQLESDGHNNETDRINAVVVSGDYVLSKEEIKCWKSRRKEKLYKYKKEGNNKLLTAIE